MSVNCPIAIDKMLEHVIKSWLNKSKSLIHSFSILLARSFIRNLNCCIWFSACCVAVMKRLLPSCDVMNENYRLTHYHIDDYIAIRYVYNIFWWKLCACMTCVYSTPSDASSHIFLAHLILFYLIKFTSVSISIWKWFNTEMEPLKIV